MGVSDNTIGLLCPKDEQEQEQEQFDWSTVLAKSDAQLLGIARAIIANFEFLIFDKPLDQLTPAGASKVLEVLGEFVTKRGVHTRTSDVEDTLDAFCSTNGLKSHQSLRTCLISCVH